MTTDVNDVQADFLNVLLRDRKVVWVFLVNGIKLAGHLVSFDNYVIALQSPAGIQTVFKSAVSTVCEPHRIEKPRTPPRERQSAREYPRS